MDWVAEFREGNRVLVDRGFVIAENIHGCLYRSTRYADSCHDSGRINIQLRIDETLLLEQDS